jgi:outer membrane autotransporter protein
LVSGAGILSVNGTLGGTVDVESGGTLKGSGTVGGVDVASGGAVAPGNSIGTLHVAGDVSFVSGSSYDVEADATSSDKIEATGSATLSGGTVVLIPYHGATLTAGTSYTILTADGGVSGTFDGISFASSMLFLTATLSYDANDVYATVLRNGTSFASVAGTPNQGATAAAIESLGAGNALYDAVAMQGSAAAARTAYQQAAGELHANIRTSLFEDQETLTRALTARLRQAEDESAPIGASATKRAKLAYGAAIANKAAASASKLAPAVWMQGFGDWSRREGNANAASFRHQTKGVLIGADWMMVEGWRTGLAVGYSHADYQQDAGGDATGQADRYSAAAYAGGKLGPVALRAGATYTYHEMTTKRALGFAYYEDYLKGAMHAHSGGAFAEAAYDLGAGATKVEPFGRLAIDAVRVEDFAETGGAAALRVTGGIETLGTTTLGARLRQGLPLVDAQEGKATFEASAGWQRAIGDLAPADTYHFGGGEAFKIEGAPLARDAAALEAGIDYALDTHFAFGLAYAGRLAPAASSQTLRGSAVWRF